MSKSKTVIAEEKSTLFSVRFLISLLLIVGGIAWLVFYYAQARGNPLAFPPVEGSPKAVAAHPATPLGRGRGVVVGMLGCFLIGLLWICTFYVFSDDLSSLWVFNDLGQWNLVVGIAFMAVGFSFATKWE